MVWISATVFMAVGIYLIVRRHELARGEGLTMGATILPGCVVAQGIFFVLLALAFILLYRLGLFGTL
jgi:hypothetical protein